MINLIRYIDLLHFLSFLFNSNEKYPKALSISSDKTIKIWDLGMHRVLKSWDFHTDAIHSLYVNDYFTKLITGSKNGELFLTDISRNCYCAIDQIKNENIISIAMNDKNQVLIGTDKSKLVQYVKQLFK